MINEADSRTLRSALRLHQPEGYPLLEFLRARYKKSRDDLVSCPCDMLTSKQGYAKALRDLLEVVDQAASVLERLEAAERARPSSRGHS